MAFLFIFSDNVFCVILKQIKVSSLEKAEIGPLSPAEVQNYFVAWADQLLLELAVLTKLNKP